MKLGLAERWFPGSLAAVLGAAALVAVQPAIALGAPGAPRSALTQLSGSAGCTVDASSTPVAGCRNAGRALKGASGVAISPDGYNVYVASKTSHAVAAFSRDRVTGELTQLDDTAGCISEGGADGCGVGRALQGAASVAVSPDGENVYVASSGSHAVAVLARNPISGTLTQLADAAGCVVDATASGIGGCDSTGRALKGAATVAVSPDGKSVYVVSPQSSGVAVFTRDADTGALSQPAATQGCVSHDADGAGSGSPVVVTCAPARALLNATGGAVSVDGRNLYVASDISGSRTAVAVFDRSLVSGALGQKEGAAGCIWSGSSAGDCLRVDLLGAYMKRARSVAVAPDDTTVHVGLGEDSGADRGGIFTLSRTTADGTLSMYPDHFDSNCISMWGACLRGRALSGASAVAVSPDGQGAYVAASWSDAVSATRRLPEDPLAPGHLEQPTTDARYCIVDAGADGPPPPGPIDNCLNSGRALNGAAGVAVSPDPYGAHVYVAAAQSASVAVFDRSAQLAPACADESVIVHRNTPVTVKLSCADPDGDPLTYKILVSPVHGALSDVDQAAGTVTYAPASDYPRVGSEGGDSFHFEATDGMNPPVEASQTLVFLPEHAQATGTARHVQAAGTARVRIFGRALRLSRSGKVKVGLGCRAPDEASRCSGTLTLKVDRRSNRRSGKRVRALTLGRARYSIAAGKTGRVKVRITRTARRLLARQPRARAWVWAEATAAGVGEQGATETSKTTILLKAPSR